jgi:exopolysaccharide biosynthesis polyprenyl glycosylphosphotransferase
MHERDASVAVNHTNMALANKSSVTLSKSADDRAWKKRHQIAATFVASDLLSFAFGFWLLNNLLGSPQFLGQSFAVAVFCLVTYFAYGSHLNVHSSANILSFKDAVGKAAAAFGFAVSALLFFVFFFKLGDSLSRLLVIGSLASTFVILALARLWVVRCYGITSEEQLMSEVIIVECPSTSAVVHNSPALQITEELFDFSTDNASSLATLGRFVHGNDRVVVYCPDDQRLKWSNILRSLDVAGELAFPELITYLPVGVNQRGDMFTVTVNTGPFSMLDKFLKRALDLIVVFSLIPMVVPFCIIVAVLVKMESPGPIFFRQMRVGLSNRQFLIWKFRTMYVAQADAGASRLTERFDTRVTKIGRLLRASSVDELPQLINVLVGDMSLVGPRPHAPLATAGGRLYWEVDPKYWQRHVVKPGITGLAQIEGHRGNTFTEKDLQQRLDADLLYVSNWSLSKDINILFRTIFLLSHKNAF